VPALELDHPAQSQDCHREFASWRHALENVTDPPVITGLANWDALDLQDDVVVMTLPSAETSTPDPVSVKRVRPPGPSTSCPLARIATTAATRPPSAAPQRLLS